METPTADLLTLALRERLFSVEEYHALAKAGVLGDEDRVELLDGRLLVMSPIGSRHLHAVNRLTDLLAERLYSTSPRAARLSIQNPVRLGARSEPEPDVVLLRPDAPQDRTPIPEDVLLVVEVADSSAEYDRQMKQPRYAAAGVVELWIVVLDEGVVEVYRHPSNGRYTDIKTHGRDAAVEVLALPAWAPVPVAAMLG